MIFTENEIQLIGKKLFFLRSTGNQIHFLDKDADCRISDLIIVCVGVRYTIVFVTDFYR